MLYITDNYSSCTSRVRGNNLFTSFWLASKKETLTICIQTTYFQRFQTSFSLRPSIENQCLNKNWKISPKYFLTMFQISPEGDLVGPYFWGVFFFKIYPKTIHKSRVFFLEIRGSMTFKTRLSMKKEAKSWISIRTCQTMSSERKGHGAFQWWGGGVVPECPKWGKLVELDGHFWIHLVCLSWKKEIIELKGRWPCPLSTPTWPLKLGHSRWHSLVNFTGIRQDLQTCSAFFAYWEKVNSKAGWFINPFEKYWRVKLHHSPKNQGEHFPNHLSCHHLSNGVSWNPI